VVRALRQLLASDGSVGGATDVERSVVLAAVYRR